MKILMRILFLIFLYSCCLIDAKKNGGVYRYIHKNSGKTHYVGATNNFKRRHSEHVRDNRYFTNDNYNVKKYYMETSNKNNLANKERQYINKYKPVANKKKGGGGL